MINRILIIICIVFFPCCASGQDSYVDSLYFKLMSVKNDSEKYSLYKSLYFYYNMHNRDSALYYCDQRIRVARENDDHLAESNALAHKSFQLNVFGQYSKALECLIAALQIAEDGVNERSSFEFPSSSNYKHNRLETLNNVHYHFGHLLGSTLDRNEQIYHYKIAHALAKETMNLQMIFFSNLSLGRVYMELGRLDSALLYQFEAEKYSDAESGFNGALFHQTGKIYYMKGDLKRGKSYLYHGVQKSKNDKNLTTLIRNYYELTNIYLDEKNSDSSLYYSMLSLDIAKTMGSAIYTGYDKGMMYENVYHSYDLIGQNDSINKYMRLALLAKDSIYKVKIMNLADFQKLNIAKNYTCWN